MSFTRYSFTNKKYGLHVFDIEFRKYEISVEIVDIDIDSPFGFTCFTASTLLLLWFNNHAHKETIPTEIYNYAVINMLNGLKQSATAHK